VRPLFAGLDSGDALLDQDRGALDVSCKSQCLCSQALGDAALVTDTLGFFGALQEGIKIAKVVK
jgi:hypothetical protein